MDWIRLIHINCSLEHLKLFLKQSMPVVGVLWLSFLDVICIHDIQWYSSYVYLYTHQIIKSALTPSHRTFPPLYSFGSSCPGFRSRFRWSFPSVKWPWETTKISSHSALKAAARGEGGCHVCQWEESGFSGHLDVLILRVFFLMI